MKTAVYTGTRNLYYEMVGAAKSLLCHSDVDQIYFLIEDDNFPYELSDKITTINVSNQTYFKTDGPNFNSPFTYMALMRTALAKILPSLDLILSLDVDTIVNENISDLWNLDMTNYYFAAAKQPINCKDDYLDINCGVMLINLKKLREDHKDDELINYINTTYDIFPEQNAINKLCQNYILEIDSDYNVNNSTDFKNIKSKKITHYAGVHEWQKYPYFKYYFSIPNNMLIYNQKDKIDLDIIIPSYNDEKGLIKTLSSIYYPDLKWIHITVIDDCSTIDYTPIIQQFPNISLIKLNINQGPGNARYVGIKNTHCSYLTFIDCGDIILSKYCLLAIKEELDEHRIYDIYEWSWIESYSNTIKRNYESSTPAKIYKRQFLEAYKIYPYHTGVGSYAGEDCGFNLACWAIIANSQKIENIPYCKTYELPIYQTTINQQSLTFKNNREFLYKSIPGIVENGIHCITLCEKNQVDPDLICAKMNLFLMDLYHIFLRCCVTHIEFVLSYWQDIRNFYFQCYKKYENLKENENWQDQYFHRRVRALKKLIPRPNYKRFIRELATQEQVPEHYYSYFKG